MEHKRKQKHSKSRSRKKGVHRKNARIVAITAVLVVLIALPLVFLISDMLVTLYDMSILLARTNPGREVSVGNGYDAFSVKFNSYVSGILYCSDMHAAILPDAFLPRLNLEFISLHSLPKYDEFPILEFEKLNACIFCVLPAPLRPKVCVRHGIQRDISGMLLAAWC